MSNLAEAQRTAGGGPGDDADQPKLVQMLRKLDRGISVFEEIALAICLATLLFIGVYGAIKARFFPPNPFWAHELIRYSVFFIGLIGAALAAQAERLFNIDMFTRLFGPRAKLVIRMITSAFTVYVCWLVMNGSLTLRAKALMGEKGELIAPSIGVLSIPIAMALISAHLLIHILQDLVHLSGGTLPPELAAPQPPKA